MFITVIIPTKNRQESVEDCILSVAKANIPPDTQIECIVVDNNSTDDTAKLVQELLSRLPFPGRYVFHAKPGTASARNAGLRHASGDVVAFTDDDCYVHENWLVEIEKLFSLDEDIEVAGGRVELYDDKDLPITIKTSLDPMILKRAHQVRGFSHGCNTVARRSLIDRIGAFDERFGTGTPLPAEDADFVYRAYKSGAKMRYSPEFVVYHHHKRSKKKQADQIDKSYKVGSGALYLKHILSGNLDVLSIFAAQLRPPLRRWMFGPNRREFFVRYLEHIFNCSYLAVGAYEYLKLYISGKTQHDNASFKART